jgi:EAL domain-containing protein (putative c-di-GMP-specific phosphodiesterase class I)
MENQHLSSVMDSSYANSYIDPDSYFDPDPSFDQDTETHLISAIQNNDFLLLFQLIEPLNDESLRSKHYEVFLRLIEEEASYLPPGAFFPLAEEHGLMPALDRWVVKNVLNFSANSASQNILNECSMFFVNLAGATIRDPAFAHYVKESLLESGMPGSCLCFEIAAGEITTPGADVAGFADALRNLGCRIAISGFDRDEVSFKLISGLHIDFLKIDGNIIFNIHREAAELGKAAAIHKAAKKLGIQTVAEFVEREEDISRLRKIGIDFVQGFGVSKPGYFE